ncbi:MAG: hypothetical protein KKG73_15945, partial [Gammaproteobacteria bacterium]|nr:hypothetical protein [Gammaproteobacteria bacterium]
MDDIRRIGKTNNERGVIGIRLAENDHVVGVSLAKEDWTVLNVTEHGFGKRTKV